MQPSRGKDRRADIRRECDSGIRIEDLRTGDRLSGRVYNYSGGGVYIELDRRLISGMELFIFVESAGHAPPLGEFRGTVRWSNEIQGAVVLNSYGAGLKFSTKPQRRRQASRLQVIEGGAS